MTTKNDKVEAKPEQVTAPRNTEPLSREELKKPVKIRHSKTKAEAECLPSALPAWEESGWTRVDNK